MDYQLHKKARKKVKRIKGFYIHASTYCIMGVFFFAMNTVTDPFDMWFFYPMIPWGAFLAFHYLIALGIPGTNILSPEWEEKEYDKQLAKLERNKYGFSPNHDVLEDDDPLDLSSHKSFKASYFKDDMV